MCLIAELISCSLPLRVRGPSYVQVGSDGSGAGSEADAEELEKMRAQLAETEQLMEMVRTCLFL